MADPSTKEREMASLYVFSAALKGQELNIPDYKHFDGAKGPERPALVDQGIRDIWTDTKIRSGGLKMEDIFSYQHQGKVLVEYLKDRGANSKRNKWKYGRFDGTQGVNSCLLYTSDAADE